MIGSIGLRLVGVGCCRLDKVGVMRCEVMRIG